MQHAATWRDQESNYHAASQKEREWQRDLYCEGYKETSWLNNKYPERKSIRTGLQQETSCLRGFGVRQGEATAWQREVFNWEEEVML